ncbi:MAG: class I SAM-dependent methyltransferase [Kiritimatiellae bacterium]|nr:class I SAM-dependent methyltransferase [Kiritimatiellia bacterium]
MTPSTAMAVASLQIETIVACPKCHSREAELVTRGMDYEYGTCTDTFTFVKCKQCAVLYLQNRPAASELSRIYPATYQSYSFHKNRNLTFMIRNWILERRRMRSFMPLLPEEGAVLDIGCGDPCFLEALRRMGSRKLQLWGNDINPAVLAHLETAGFKAAEGRFEEINLPAGSFNVIFMRNIIEHVANPMDMLAKAFRLLRPGGKLIVLTPNTDCLSARFFKNSYWFEYHIPRHWTLFDPISFSRAARECGFKVTAIKFRHSPYSWVLSIHNFLKANGFPAFVYNRFTLYSPIAMMFGSLIDMAQQLFSGTTSNMEVILTK